MNLKLPVFAFITTSILASCGSSSQVKEELFTQHVVFPTGADLEEKVSIASRLVPSDTQLAWQQLELTAFIHYGMNTFTGREWGDGSEDPKLYNPTNLDTDQWVRELSDAGFKMVILTAKHHDGFCLWDTKTTEHSVRFSPAWQDGKGDVMASLRSSCDKYGMKLGVYLSPWDRNNPSYGTGEAYNKLYLEQLRELLSNYGRIDEVWFDGANGEGPNGKKQIYDWDAVLSLIHKLQPRAVTAIMGTDVRWVGNERGLGRETEWSATPLAPQSLHQADSIMAALGIKPTSADLGSRDLLAKAGELFWYPSEVDTSIRPGWFYHPTEEPKTLATLVNIYFNSVGMNSTLLLNIPPTPEGRLSDEDVQRIREFGAYVTAFNTSEITTQRTPYSIDNSLEKPVLTIDIDPSKPFDAVVLQEDINRGQRIESFDIEALVGDTWQFFGRGTTVGYKRIIITDGAPLRASKIRVTITGRRGDVHNLRVGAFKVPAVITEDAADEPEGVPMGKGWEASAESDNALSVKLSTPFRGFIFTPEDGNTVTRYRVMDGKGNLIQEDEFDNIINNPIPRTIVFPRPMEGALRILFLDNAGQSVLVRTSGLSFLK